MRIGRFAKGDECYENVLCELYLLGLPFWKSRKSAVPCAACRADLRAFPVACFCGGGLRDSSRRLRFFRPADADAQGHRTHGYGTLLIADFISGIAPTLALACAEAVALALAYARTIPNAYSFAVADEKADRRPPAFGRCHRH